MRYAFLVLQEIDALGIYRHTGCYKPTVTLQQLPMADLRLRKEETLLVSISVSFSFSFASCCKCVHATAANCYSNVAKWKANFVSFFLCKNLCICPPPPLPKLTRRQLHIWHKSFLPPSEIVFCLYDDKIFIEKNSHGACPYNLP